MEFRVGRAFQEREHLERYARRSVALRDGRSPTRILLLEWSHSILEMSASRRCCLPLAGCWWWAMDLSGVGLIQNEKGWWEVKVWSRLHGRQWSLRARRLDAFTLAA